jgi:hypothetical protein
MARQGLAMPNGSCEPAVPCDDVVLSHFSSGLFRAMFAMMEIWNCNEIHRQVSA